MGDDETTVERLKGMVKAFAKARNWDPYHTPKNLSMALAVEAAELMEIFQWRTPEESQLICHQASEKQAIADELADIFCLLLQLSFRCGIDLSLAIRDKMPRNELKYPVPE